MKLDELSEEINNATYDIVLTVASVDGSLLHLNAEDLNDVFAAIDSFICDDNSLLDAPYTYSNVYFCDCLLNDDLIVKLSRHVDSYSKYKKSFLEFRRQYLLLRHRDEIFGKSLAVAA